MLLMLSYYFSAQDSFSDSISQQWTLIFHIIFFDVSEHLITYIIEICLVLLWFIIIILGKILGENTWEKILGEVLGENTC